MENLQDARFFCEKCDKCFANKANLKRHQETHGEKKVCLICCATFSTTETLRKHNKSHHEAVGSVPEIHQSLASPNAPSNDSLNSTSKSNTIAAVSNNFFSTSGHQPASLFLPTKPSTMQAATIGNFTGPSPKKEKSHVCSVCKKGYTTAEGRIKHIIQKHQDKVPEMITIPSETSQSIATTPDPPKKVKTFANPQHLPKHDKEKRLGLEVGDRILTPTYQHGTLRYKGDVDFASGTWAGVELDTPTGKNDGSMKHRRYFQCREKHGLFLLLAKLTKLQLSTNAQDTTGSGSLHERVSTPENTAHSVRGDTIGLTSSPFASISTQSMGGSNNDLGQINESPSQAKKRSAPPRCNHCEGCELNQRGEDCRECRYCKDKTKYGGRNTLRKPCEKRKCTAQQRPSFKDGEGASSPKRALPVTADEDLSLRQGPSMLKKKKGEALNSEDRIKLKLEKEQAEKMRKKAEQEKRRQEKSLIQARVSANRFKTERDKMERENVSLKNQMERENASLKNQITNVQQDLKHIKEMAYGEAEKNFKDKKEKLERELTELKTDKDKMEEEMDQAKAVMLNELQSLRDENSRLSKDKSELQSLREENERLKRDIADIESSDPGMYCDICDVAPHNTEDCPEQEQIYESLI